MCVCVCVCVCVIHFSHQEVYLELRTDVAGRYHVNLVSNTLPSYQRVQSVRNITGEAEKKENKQTFMTQCLTIKLYCLLMDLSSAC